MSQKTNKIIVFIAFITVVSFIIYIAISQHNFKIISEIPRGEIKGDVTGPSYDAQVFDTIGLPNINLSFSLTKLFFYT